MGPCDQRRQLRRDWHRAERTDIRAAGVAGGNEADRGQRRGTDQSQQLARQLAGPATSQGPDQHVEVRAHVFPRRDLPQDMSAFQMPEARVVVGRTTSFREFCGHEGSDVPGESVHVVVELSFAPLPGRGINVARGRNCELNETAMLLLGPATRGVPMLDAEIAVRFAAAPR